MKKYQSLVPIFFVFIILVGCSGKLFNGSGNKNYRLVPISSESKPIGSGLVQFIVQIGIENIGDKNLKTEINVGDINLKTKEGYTFHYGNEFQTENYLDVQDSYCLLPPSFKKISDRYIFEIGATLHPTSLEFSKYGSVSLESIDSEFVTTNKPDNSFLEFPHSINLEKGKLKIIGNPKIDCDNYGCKLGIDMDYYNSNPAKTNTACVYFEVLDKGGQCRSQSTSNCGIQDTGPLQTTNNTVWVKLFQRIDGNFSSVEKGEEFLRGAKIFMTVDDDQFEGIFNLQIP